MINAAKEVARTVGHVPFAEAGVVAPIVSGKFVKLAAGTGEQAGETVVKGILGSEVAATVDILGIAADDTEKLPYNGMYEIIDNYFKNGKVAAYVLGGLFTIWNDGRGAVFATAEDGSSVLNAAPGTPLYIGADGALTKKADTTATNVGAIVVGSVIRAPKDADGTLFFKAKGL